MAIEMPFWLECTPETNTLRLLYAAEKMMKEPVDQRVWRREAAELATNIPPPDIALAALNSLHAVRVPLLCAYLQDKDVLPRNGKKTIG